MASKVPLIFNVLPFHVRLVLPVIELLSVKKEIELVCPLPPINFSALSANALILISLLRIKLPVVNINEVTPVVVVVTVPPDSGK